MAQQRNKRNNTPLIIGAVAVVILLIAAAFSLLSPSQPEQNKRAKPARNGRVAVPVAIREIKLGQKLDARNIDLQYFKPDEVPVDAIINYKLFMNRIAVHRIEPGSYITEKDIASPGAHAGYSGIAKKGKRIVAVPELAFPGNEAMNIGDRVDLLSIGTPSGAPPQQGNGDTRTPEQKAAGGYGPGQSGGESARRAAAARRAAGNKPNSNDPDPTSATLIAENAEVVSKSKGLIIFQMEPQDAHVTVLALSSGANMRVVFRPFDDDTRLTPVDDVKVTTRLPKPSMDPEAIVVINNGVSSRTRPLLDRYRNDSENSERFVPETERFDEPMVMDVR